MAVSPRLPRTNIACSPSPSYPHSTPSSSLNTHSIRERRKARGSSPHDHAGGRLTPLTPVSPARHRAPDGHEAGNLDEEQLDRVMTAATRLREYYQTLVQAKGADSPDAVRSHSKNSMTPSPSPAAVGEQDRASHLGHRRTHSEA